MTKTPYSPPQVADVLGQITPPATAPLSAVTAGSLQQSSHGLTLQRHALGIQPGAKRASFAAQHYDSAIPITSEGGGRLGDGFEHGQIQRVEFGRTREEDVGYAVAQRTDFNANVLRVGGRRDGMG